MSTQNKPLVSIGIPTYNRADGYLKEALESALAQTWPNLKIVVSDNGSTDHTTEFVAGYNDDRITYYRQEPALTPNGNFNFCLEKSTGDFFLLFHDDDIIDPDFVEVCMNAIGDNLDIGAAITGVRVIDDESKILRGSQNNAAGLSSTDFFHAWFNDQVPLYLCNTLYNTQHLKTVGGFNSRQDLFQDMIATAQLVCRFGRVDIKEAKASYRRHSMTRTFKVRVEDWCDDSHQLLDIITSLNPIEDRPSLRERGLEFFTTVNYSRARAMSGFINRWKMFRFVYRDFEKSYSLTRFYFDKKIRTFIRNLIR